MANLCPFLTVSICVDSLKLIKLTFPMKTDLVRNRRPAINQSTTYPIVLFALQLRAASIIAPPSQYDVRHMK